MIQASRRSCSRASARTAASSASGISTAPSPSATTTSPGITATPPQPIGSPQPTKVSSATEGGAAIPAHQTGRPVAATPEPSRTAPSVTRAARPRFFIRAQRMSPNMPAVVTPIASTTAMSPGAIASIAARVERGEAQDSGVAKSSRAGAKRRVKARPATRPLEAAPNGFGPRIATRRKPFFNRTVVKVAVEMAASSAAIAASSGMTSSGGAATMARAPAGVQRCVPPRAPSGRQSVREGFGERAEGERLFAGPGRRIARTDRGVLIAGGEDERDAPGQQRVCDRIGHDPAKIEIEDGDVDRLLLLDQSQGALQRRNRTENRRADRLELVAQILRQQKFVLDEEDTAIAQGLFTHVPPPRPGFPTSAARSCNGRRLLRGRNG